MSSRSVPRGSAAARSIRLALRASSIVATSRPSLARWVFRCRGNLATKSAMIPSLTCSIPPIPPLHPARSSVGSTAASVTQGQTDGWQALRTIKDIEQASETVGREIPYRVLLARWPVLTETVVARHTRGELAKKSVPVLATPFMDRTAWKEMVYSGRCPRVVGADSNAAHNLTAITREVLTVLANRAAEVAA